MDRRSFLKALGASLAATAIPAFSVETEWADSYQKEQQEISREAAKRYAKFMPDAEYGKAVLLGSDAPEAIEAAKECVLKDARWVLPPGTAFYVLENPMGSAGTVDPMNMYCSVYWYYSPRPLSDYRKRHLIARAIA